MPDLYLLRHGEAERGEHGAPDYTRGLTAKGMNDIRERARRLASLEAPITRIFHSPYLRALQSATLVNQAVGARLVAWPCLEPGAKVDRVLDELMGLESHLLLVSHLPLIADLAFALLGEPTVFNQGTCLKLKRENAFALKGAREWLAHPK